MNIVSSWLPVVLAAIPLLSSDSLIPKIGIKALAYRGTAFVAVCCIAYALAVTTEKDELMRRLKALVRTPLFLVLSAGIVLLACSTIVAFDPRVAFFGDIERGEGFLTLGAFYALFVVLAVVFRRKEWRRFFVATAIVTVIIFIIQSVGAARGLGRPSSTIGNPMFLAGYYVLALFSACFLFFDKTLRVGAWGRMLACVSALSSIIGILLTETRGTLLGLGVGALVASVMMMANPKGARAQRRTLRRVGIGIMAAFIAFGVIFATTRHDAFWRAIPGVNRIAEGDTTTLSSRLVFLKLTRDGFTDSTIGQKLLGWGWDNFLFFSNKNYDPSVYDFDKASADRAHNKLADMLIMAGALGLAVYLATWVFLLKGIGRMLSVNQPLGIGCFVVMIAYFVHNLFGFDVLVTFALFSAFAALMAQPYHDEAKH